MVYVPIYTNVQPAASTTANNRTVKHVTDFICALFIVISVSATNITEERNSSDGRMQHQMKAAKERKRNEIVCICTDLPVHSLCCVLLWG